MAIKIYIDQGHNPMNPNAGAEGNGYREQDITYAIGVRLASRLRELGFETRLSRPTPDIILGTSNASSLRQRVSDANSWGADYFISLHTNASNITTARGSEAYVFRLDTQADFLAQNILEQLNFATGLPNRGVFARPSLYVVRRTAMPALLLEMGFITNPTDANLMANNPGLFAEGIANGFLAYFGML
ncbi:MAG: N-acetylmuramoyl-L-alanine amidase [Ruminococcaceae bacterium]|nr:N-acetylmuramoyl-L-alanine amidase [Oscillospiraceae bacterium]